MGAFKLFEQKRLTTSTSAYPTSHLCQLSRPFASCSLSASQQDVPLPHTQAQLNQQSKQEARVGHPLAHISILAPTTAIQRKSTATNTTQGATPYGQDASTEMIRQAAQEGVQTPATTPPFLNRIQQSFGRYNISQVQAHMGDHAARSARAIQAKAFAAGNHIVFAEAPDLHTVAHEFAHVVQQRQGVQLTQGIGQAGDNYEQHAQAVANRVVTGQSSEELLDKGARDWRRQPDEKSNFTKTPSPSPLPHVIQRMMAAPVAPVAPGPTLSAATTGQSLEGDCGFFVRQRSWQVNPPVKGLIVQHIKRTFDVTRISDNKQLVGAEIDAYINTSTTSPFATDNEYWELWQVEADGSISDGNLDTFGLCAMIPPGQKRRNTTKGRFNIVGTAAFYPTAAEPTTLGFNRSTVKAAGALFSRTTDPSTVLPAPLGQAISYSVIDMWDSTYLDTGYVNANGLASKIIALRY